MELSNPVAVQKTPWNKGKLVGQKPPLRLKEIWPIRIRLQLAKRTRALQSRIGQQAPWLRPREPSGRRRSARQPSICSRHSVAAEDPATSLMRID